MSVGDDLAAGVRASDNLAVDRACVRVTTSPPTGACEISARSARTSGFP
ncbi:hypothetical protein IU433_29000 [Nocardia puris]|nr:hypothetical protein [Nocardia puris]MBF6213919.1 hypothetical protein [Nocardia puris]MBF6368558.1 hypothetical protein [Nocardia puris]MBF6463045.1 hypothetical protein [Nocardia puris]